MNPPRYIIEWRDTEARKWKPWIADTVYATRKEANERMRKSRAIYPDTRLRVARVREKCAGRTAGDYRGSLPCALWAAPGSDYCRYHDPRREV